MGLVERKALLRDLWELQIVPIDFIHDCTLVLYKQLIQTGFGCYPSYFRLSWAFLSTSPQPMTRLPLGQRGARLGMDCTADLLLVLEWDKTASGTARSKTENRQLSLAMLLLAVPEAVSSHTKTRRRYQLCSSFSVLLLAVPEAVSSHTKTRRISATRS